MEKLTIVDKKDFIPSTVTIGSTFNIDINIASIAEYMPITHIFDLSNNRVKLISGSRESIKYFGPEGSIISICFRKIRRGMRTGAMNNMVSADLQINGKNIHLKISSTAITSVGTSSIEFGRKVFQVMICHIEELKRNCDFIKSLSEETRKYNFEWMKENCFDKQWVSISLPPTSQNGAVPCETREKILGFAERQNIVNSDTDVYHIPSKKGRKVTTIKQGTNICITNILLREKDFFFQLKNQGNDNINQELILILSKYLNDFDYKDIDLYLKKINNFLKDMDIYKDKLEFSDLTIYNSVYHITPFDNDKKFRMPLHKLAPFLANLGVVVEYHNWTSEGCNTCFDIEEVKKGINHNNKEYKHRFTIHETTKIRQCSPTNKDEAYKNYLGMMNLLKLFFSTEEIDFTKYIVEDEKTLGKNSLKILERGVPGRGKKKSI